MNLGKADKSALIISITEAIQKGKAQAGAVQVPKGWGESTLKLLEEATCKRLKRTLDDGGIERFLTNELERQILLSGEEVPEIEVESLSELKALSDPLSVARTIADSVEKLPRQYRLIARASAELASRIDRDDVNIKLSDQFSLLSGALIPDSFSLKHKSELIDARIRRNNFERGKAFQIDDKALYFEYRTSGCISSRTDTRVARDFFDCVRAFYGACIVFDIIDDFDYKHDNVQPVVAATHIHEDEEEICYLSRAEDDIVRSTNLTTTLDYDHIIQDGEESLEESLKPIISLFRSKDTEKLRTAAIWIMRANLSPRHMDKVLESTIAMEVLLGDRETSDRVGLSKLMANRCAYALGKTAEDRRSIIDFFVEFYRFRSEIVHSGRFRIDEDDKKIVFKGLSLAVRMLRHEVMLEI